MKPYSHVLYHADCQDGFAAAWAAWRKLGDKAKYVPAIHGEPFPSLPTDADVLMVDMSYPRDRHLQLASLVRSLTVVDHHVTAMKDIGDLPNTHFDMNHSGAVLSWMHFYPEKPVPELLLYVEDRDLWRFKLPQSREVFAALSSHESSFELWNKLSAIGVEHFVSDGRAILRLIGRKVEQVCRSAFWKEIAGHRVPVVNATAFTSEVGHRLCELHPDAPFAGFYYDKPGLRCWGLRSVGNFDVSAIAKSLGGGGHKNAAGFTEPIEKRS